ncbi:MAG: hypothetical protein NT062_15435 [Proteobacteria bacterium]|nr:hypothetical protein [Pseudomonadota bacterium]
MLGRPEELCAITASDPIVAKKVALLEKRVRKVSGKTPLLAACPKQPRPPARTQHPIDLRVRTAR